MTQTHPTRVEAPPDRTSDAAGVAAGSSIVLAAGVLDQAMRFTVTWLLAAALGAEGFGLYSYAVTVALLLGTIAPLGLQQGVVLFGARYASSGEAARLKGTVYTALGTALVSGTLAAAGLYGVGRFRPEWVGGSELGLALATVAPAAGLATVLLVLVGLLRARKDMRAQAIAYQLALPGILLAGAVAAWTLQLSARAMLAVFASAYLAATVLAALYVQRRYAPLLRGVEAAPVAGPLFRFAIPQGFTDLVFRLTLWMDVLLLGQLASLEEVGLYRVAAALAMIGGVPVLAVHTSFNPVVAELVYGRQLDRLDALLKVVTRWLVLLATGPFLVVLLLPELVLGLFDPAYAASRNALVILMLGQAVHVACAAAVPLIPMGGRSTLELANGIVALTVNVALNLLLIPRLGPVGAAIASAVSLSLWAALRVVEGRWLLGCFPFDARTGGLIVAAVAGGIAITALGPGLPARMALVGLLLTVWAALAWRFGRTDEDGIVLAQLRARVAQKFGIRAR